MNEYKIGRDLQVLRSRIERLECGYSPEERVRNSGTARQEVCAGVDRYHEPLHWKSEEAVQLQPFLAGLLGLPERIAQFNVFPESKTWKEPRPLLLFVNWDSGGSDEFYRFQNQLFSIIRITEPNSGHISCTATYSAKLIASGRASSKQFLAPQGYSRFLSQLNITLRGAQGAPLTASLQSPPYSIACHDNYEFVHVWDFNAGLYDLVAGATWDVTGIQYVDRC